MLRLGAFAWAGESGMGTLASRVEGNPWTRRTSSARSVRSSACCLARGNSRGELQPAQTTCRFLDVSLLDDRGGSGCGIGRTEIPRRPIGNCDWKREGNSPALPAVPVGRAPIRADCNKVASSTAIPLLPATAAVFGRLNRTAAALVNASCADHAHAGDFAGLHADAEGALLHWHDASARDLQVAVGVETEGLDNYLLATRCGATGERHALARSGQCGLPLVAAVVPVTPVSRGELSSRAGGSHVARTCETQGGGGICLSPGLGGAAAEPESAGRKTQRRKKAPAQMRAALHRLAVKSCFRPLSDSALQPQYDICHNHPPSDRLPEDARELCEGQCSLEAGERVVSKEPALAADVRILSLPLDIYSNMRRIWKSVVPARLGVRHYSRGNRTNFLGESSREKQPRLDPIGCSHPE